MVKVGIITLSVVGDRTLRTPLRAQLFLPEVREWSSSSREKLQCAGIEPAEARKNF